MAAAAAALRRTELIEPGTRSLENSLTPRSSFQAQGRNTPSSVSLIRELNGARSFAPSICRLARAQARTKAPTVPLRHCASPFVPSSEVTDCDSYYTFNVPKVDCAQKSTTIGPVRKANERNERHIYIVSL